MKRLRLLHLYLGCFFAPMLLFFVLTGWVQTFTKQRNKTPGEAEDLLHRLISIHVDQIWPSPTAEAYSPALFKALVALMSGALLIAILIGLLLAFKVSRSKAMVCITLLMGVILPVLALLLGQKH